MGLLYMNYPTNTLFFTLNPFLFCLSLQVEGAVVGQVRSEVSAPKEFLWGENQTSSDGSAEHQEAWFSLKVSDRAG